MKINNKRSVLNKYSLSFFICLYLFLIIYIFFILKNVLLNPALVSSAFLGFILLAYYVSILNYFEFEEKGGMVFIKYLNVKKMLCLEIREFPIQSIVGYSIKRSFGITILQMRIIINSLQIESKYVITGLNIKKYRFLKKYLEENTDLHSLQILDK